MTGAEYTRWGFLRAAVLAGAGLVVPGAFAGCARSAAVGAAEVAVPGSRSAGWEQVPAILARIRPPAFPKRDFVITQYGAIGNGTTDASAAVRQAIDACHHAGGGRVVVPAGRFLTGPVHLKSNVDLHVKKDGTLAFSTRSEDYFPVVFTRYEGIEIMGPSPLIYAFEQENIAITGTGTLDGQAGTGAWWP